MEGIKFDIQDRYFSYHLALAILLSIILTPSISGILFDDLLWFYALGVKKLKLVLLGVILFYEAKFSQLKWYRNLVVLVALGIFLDFFFKIMHWPKVFAGIEFIPLLFFIFALVFHLVKKDRPVFHLLFLSYLPMMYVHFNFRIDDTLWWCDFLLSLIIWLVSIMSLFNMKVKRDN